MNWRFISCCAQRKRLSLLAAGVLPEPEHAALHRHLDSCAACRNRYAALTRLSAACALWAAAEEPAEPAAAFRARWMQAVQGAADSTSAVSPNSMARWTESFWPSPVAWGALAAVWILLFALRHAAPARLDSGIGLAAGSPHGTAVRLAERQREISSLLDSLSASKPPQPDVPRPRTQRQPESATA